MTAIEETSVVRPSTNSTILVVYRLFQVGGVGGHGCASGFASWEETLSNNGETEIRKLIQHLL